jgi:peptidoglycan/LPS O-acetylase OafA/YrhL
MENSAPQTDPTLNNRLRSYDFLRGLAIAGVVAVHTSMIFRNGLNGVFFMGRFGVQLFFLVSAMTMCRMWEAREGEHNQILGFYIRRFLRIAPLFWVALALYWFTRGIAAVHGPWIKDGMGLKQLVTSALFVNGFFPDCLNSIVPGGWSIAVEMTFYAVFPLVALKMGRRPRTFLLAGALLYFIYAILLANPISDYVTANYGRNGPVFATEFYYYNILSQLPVFLIGCCLFFTLKENTKSTIAPALLCAIWLGLSGTYLVVTGEIVQMNHVVLLTITLALAVLSYLCVRLNARFKPLEYIGRKSYEIYLFHFIVLDCLHALYVRSGLPYQGLALFCVVYAVTVLLACGVAIGVNRLVERPISRLRKLLLTRFCGKRGGEIITVVGSM